MLSAAYLGVRVMKRYTSEKQRAWEAHAEKYKCEHPSSKLCARVVKGGITQYVKQCQTCGAPLPGPIAKKVAFEMSGGVEPVPFDEEIRKRWEGKKNRAAERIREKYSEKFWNEYSDYLATPEWDALRRGVLERANGKCEGCRSRPPEEVHHLSYEHVGDEFLFELVAVCKECHKRLHPESSP